MSEHRTALRPDTADRARVLDGLLKRLEVNHLAGKRHVMQSPRRLMEWLGLASAKA